MIQKNLRRGLTLIELVVVLTVLVALGGLAVATLPNMLNRTHVATVATSLPAVDSTLRQNILLNSGQIGDTFDSLVDTDLTGSVVGFVNASGAYAEHTLAGNDVAALADLGITELVPATDGVDNATFEGHNNTPVALADGLNVCVLAATEVDRILEEVWNYTAQTDAEYVVVGLGERCSLVGAGEDAFFTEAPLHYVDAHSERADNSYARVMIVIELADAGTVDAEARYIGVGAPHPDGVQGVATHLREWYSN